MLMGDYKFDTFYYTKDQSSEHYLSEIEDLSYEYYITLFKGKMYCPWCKGPQLGLVKSKNENSFLRTYPKQKHIVVDEELCPYESKTASNKLVKKYIQELKEKKKIKSLLESIMRRIFDLDVPKQTVEINTGNLVPHPLLIEDTEDNKTVESKIIPHYSFRTWGKNIPPEQLLVVYGKVYVQLLDFPTNKGEMQTYIHFKDIRSEKLITSCIKPHKLEISEGYYYAVLLGECHPRESKGHIFYNLWVNDPIDDSILLKPFLYKN